MDSTSAASPLIAEVIGGWRESILAVFVVIQ